MDLQQFTFGLAKVDLNSSSSAFRVRTVVLFFHCIVAVYYDIFPTDRSLMEYLEGLVMRFLFTLNWNQVLSSNPFGWSSAVTPP